VGGGQKARGWGASTGRGRGSGQSRALSARRIVCMPPFLGLGACGSVRMRVCLLGHELNTGQVKVNQGNGRESPKKKQQHETGKLEAKLTASAGQKNNKSRVFS